MLVYSVRKVISNYTGGMVRIARASDQALADLFMDTQATIKKLVVVVNSTSQPITKPNDITDWIGAGDPSIMTWYD